LNNYYSRTNDRNDFNRNNLPGRGDIPIIHGDCDGNSNSLRFFLLNNLRILFSENLLRGINDLIALVKQLRDDVARQHAEITRLRTLIENCAGCQEGAALRMPPSDTCQFANPCFPGKWL
jgi:thrombospondin 2/3/4/5